MYFQAHYGGFEVEEYVLHFKVECVNMVHFEGTQVLYTHIEALALYLSISILCEVKLLASNFSEGKIVLLASPRLLDNISY